eukprot:gene11742-5080_t
MDHQEQLKDICSTLLEITAMSAKLQNIRKFQNICRTLNEKQKNEKLQKSVCIIEDFWISTKIKRTEKQEFLKKSSEIFARSLNYQEQLKRKKEQLQVQSKLDLRRRNFNFTPKIKKEQENKPDNLQQKLQNSNKKKKGPLKHPKYKNNSIPIYLEPLTNEQETEKIEILKRIELINQEINKEKEILQEKEEYSKLYREKLHEYNLIKDIAQEIFGRIAMKDNTTVSEIYEKFDIDFD